MRALLMIGLAFLAGCAPATKEAEPLRSGRTGTPATELESDYEFEEFPGSLWYGPDGSEVSDDSNVINAITGPEHCDWQSAVMMHLGWPLGHDAADVSESRQHLRDPEGVFPSKALMTSYSPDVELPQSAEYTGYRTDFMELWLAPGDDTAAYLVFADHVERWPWAEEAIACA